MKSLDVSNFIFLPRWDVFIFLFYVSLLKMHVFIRVVCDGGFFKPAVKEKVGISMIYWSKWRIIEIVKPSMQFGWKFQTRY